VIDRTAAPVEGIERAPRRFRPPQELPMQRVLAVFRPFRGWSDVGLDASNRTLLMIHDGELADVKMLAESIGVQVIDGIATGATPEWDARHERVTPRASTSPVRAERGARSRCSTGTRARARTLLRRSGVNGGAAAGIRRRCGCCWCTRSIAVPSGAPGASRSGAGSLPAGTAASATARSQTFDARLSASPVTTRVGQRRRRVGARSHRPMAAALRLRGSSVRTMTTDGGERGFGVDFGKVAKSSPHLQGCRGHRTSTVRCGIEGMVSPAIARARCAAGDADTGRWYDPVTHTTTGVGREVSRPRLRRGRFRSACGAGDA
jgi:hypothetical protein